MIKIKDAYEIALNTMPGYKVVSISETENGWFFSFALEDGSIPDISPMLISKETGKIESYIFEERMLEILSATPVDVSDL